jgi:hypothetical protein
MPTVVAFRDGAEFDRVVGGLFAAPAVKEVHAAEHGRLEATRRRELPPPMANMRAQMIAHSRTQFAQTVR